MPHMANMIDSDAVLGRGMVSFEMNHVVSEAHFIHFLLEQFSFLIHYTVTGNSDARFL